MKHFTPFANESDTFAIGALTAENRLDRVALFGDLDLTRDQTGLAQALELQALVDAVVKALQADAHLPAAVTLAPVTTVKNPFSS